MTKEHAFRLLWIGFGNAWRKSRIGVIIGHFAWFPSWFSEFVSCMQIQSQTNNPISYNYDDAFCVTFSKSNTKKSRPLFKLTLFFSSLALSLSLMKFISNQFHDIMTKILQVNKEEIKMICEKWPKSKGGIKECSFHHVLFVSLFMNFYSPMKFMF